MLRRKKRSPNLSLALSLRFHVLVRTTYPSHRIYTRPLITTCTNTSKFILLQRLHNPPFRLQRNPRRQAHRDERRWYIYGQEDLLLESARWRPKHMGKTQINIIAMCTVSPSSFVSLYRIATDRAFGPCLMPHLKQKNGRVRSLMPERSS